MTRVKLRAGFIPLIDCAPLIVAAKTGLGAAEGLDIELVRETSWATLRDRMAVGHLDAAHMLAPMPIAANLGLTPLPARLVAPMSLGSGGNTITVSKTLWAELHQHGATADLDAARGSRAFASAVAARRAAARPKLVIAVVHTHSAHRYQLAYWLSASGVDPRSDIDLVVVPPSLMASALAAGQIDGFSAGEPWGSVAAAIGAGVIVTTNAHIWRSSPEKVLGLREAWVEANADVTDRLVRAVQHAAVWCDDANNREELAKMLAQAEVLAGSAEVIRNSLERRVVRADGEVHEVDGFLSFAARSGTFPWISHAFWFYSQMIRWGETEYREDLLTAARSAYRPDIFRRALDATGITLPAANSKVEGLLKEAYPVGSAKGTLYLGPDSFFDGRVFDPDRVADYVASL